MDALTTREREVLGWIRQGLSNKEIATELSCTVKTIEFHVGNLLRKAGAKSRLLLVVKSEPPHESAFRQQTTEPEDYSAGQSPGSSTVKNTLEE